MLRLKMCCAVALSLLLGACAASRSPVPLVGGSADVSALTGELSGNAIAGTYTTRLPSGETQTGRWSVQRRN